MIRAVIPKIRTRISRQWAVGDGGMRGIRMVKKGAICWSNMVYAHSKLIPFAGEWVFIEDFAVSEITISQCLWTAHYHNRAGHPYPGKFICEVGEVKNG